MPPFMKDDIKKKDEERLSEMQREIDEELSSTSSEQPAVPPSANKGKVNAYANIYKQTAEQTTPTPEGEAFDVADGQVTDEGASNGDADLAAENTRLTEQLKETDSSLKRLRADFENYRRRTTKEKEDLSAFVTANFMKDLLPLVDNFERAMVAEDNDPVAFRQGINMIAGQFWEILAKNGLSKINTDGAKFDPNFHQAVMRIENSDLPDGSIAQVLQTGYMVKDKVIRPSMVQVVGN